LRNDHRNMLEKSLDLQSGGFNRLNVPDVNDVFRYHFGDKNWKAIDDIMYQVDNTDIYTKGGKEKLSKRIEEKITVENVEGPGEAGHYMAQDQIKKRIDDIDEAMEYIAHGDEGWIKEAGAAEREAKLKEYAKESQAYQKLLKKENFPSDVTPPFEVISGTSKKGKEISEKLGITAKPGFPVTETGKPDLKLVPKSKKRDSLNIRIMKNFNEPLDDVGLAQEGYSVQEIQVLKNARKRLETGEETHPNEALLREKELLADEAGVDVDELTLAIDWGDMTPGNASGGLPRRRYAFGSKGELTDLLQRLKQVQMGEGIYADYSSSNRKAMQRVLTNRINVLLSP